MFEKDPPDHAFKIEHMAIAHTLTFQILNLSGILSIDHFSHQLNISTYKHLFN